MRFEVAERGEPDAEAEAGAAGPTVGGGGCVFVGAQCAVRNGCKVIYSFWFSHMGLDKLGACPACPHEVVLPWAEPPPAAQPPLPGSHLGGGPAGGRCLLAVHR